MNSRLASFSLLAAFLIITGCNFNRDKNKAAASEILNNPPFESITDSIGKYPDNVLLYLRRADMLSQQNMPELAYPDYKKAWELRKDEAVAISYTASLFMTGRENEAISLLQECIKKFPGNIEFPRRLSEAYMQSGKTEAALNQYDKLIQADSTNFEALYERGILLADLKDTVQAVKSLERAYNLQPLQLVGVALANLYAEIKDKRVLAICDDIIDKDSAQELTDPVFIKGIYFANTQQNDEALEQFENCINRDWKFTEAYIEKGIILFKQNNIDEALKTFALAARVSNTYPDAYYWMGRCYENIGQKEEARENYMRALGLDKKFTEAKDALKRLD